MFFRIERERGGGGGVDREVERDMHTVRDENEQKRKKKSVHRDKISWVRLRVKLGGTWQFDTVRRHTCSKPGCARTASTCLVDCSRPHCSRLPSVCVVLVHPKRDGCDEH